MNWTRIGAALMFLGVALGAFGAHALKDKLDARGHEVWRTAVLYHLVHAVAIYARGQQAWLFLAGIVVFSGSLYLLALTGQSWLGALTPVGGLLFLAGWLRAAL